MTSVNPVEVRPVTRGRFNLRRRLAGTAVLFSVTVPGYTTQGLIQSLNHFQSNFGEVHETIGVEEEEVRYPKIWTVFCGGAGQ